MKKLITICLFLLAVNSFGQPNAEYATNEIIVKFKNAEKGKQHVDGRVVNSKFAELHQQLDVSEYLLTGNKKIKDTYVIKFNGSAYSVDEAIALYKATNECEYVEPNYIGRGSGQLATTPDDIMYYNRQWGLYNDGTFTLSPSIPDADIDMELAWDIETGDPNLIVAILDSGIKLDHPEFDGRIWVNSDEIQNNSDSDGNGYIDDVNGGWDFVNGDNFPADDHGHGTNVAGIAMATGNNGIGYAGVNWNSRLMVCKILDNTNSGLYTWWAEAIRYAVDNGAKVINMSVGGSGVSTLLQEAVDYAHGQGAIIVVSMMNFNNATPYYPAAYPNTIAVGSTNPNDRRTVPFFWSPTSGSNFGNHIDVVAPGNYMYGLSNTSNTNYNGYWGGTSQAAPLVTGLVSLLLSQEPTLTFEQVRALIRITAEDQVGDPAEDVAGWDRYYGAGRINAHKALDPDPLVVGLKDRVLENDLLIIFPNPVSNNGYINFEGLNPTNYHVRIFDACGSKVSDLQLINSGRKSTLSIDGLSAGTYIIKLREMHNNMSFTRKLIIN